MLRRWKGNGEVLVQPHPDERTREEHSLLAVREKESSGHAARRRGDSGAHAARRASRCRSGEQRELFLPIRPATPQVSFRPNLRPALAGARKYLR
jgi:hypothetical protein